MGKTIWYISKYARPFRDGIATRHFYLSREFNNLGYSSTVICSDSNHLISFPSYPRIYNHVLNNNVSTVIIRTKKYKGAFSLGRIISWLDFEMKLLFMPKNKLSKPDIIITSSLSLFTILTGYIFKRLYKAKLIFEVRDIWPLTLIEIGGFKKSNPLIVLLHWIEKFGYRNSDIVVGTMPNLSEHVESVTKQGYKCHTIPQGIDLSIFQVNEPIDYEYIESNIPKDKFIICYAGTIGRANALDTFIKVSILLKDNENIHFLVIGDGDQKTELKSLVRTNSNITFAPRIRKNQVQNVLNYCDVLYASAKDSNLYRFGLSLNKIIDYMYAAKPIILSYNGFPSMINEADCGVIVPAENIEKLKSTIINYSKMDKQKLCEIGLRGKEWLIQNRTFSKLALKYTELFN